MCPSGTSESRSTSVIASVKQFAFAVFFWSCLMLLGPVLLFGGAFFGPIVLIGSLLLDWVRGRSAPAESASKSMGIMMMPIAYARQHLSPPPITDRDMEKYPGKRMEVTMMEAEGRPAGRPAAAAAAAWGPSSGSVEDRMWVQPQRGVVGGGEIREAEERQPSAETHREQMKLPGQTVGGGEGEEEEVGEHFASPVGTWEAASPEVETAIEEEIEKLGAVVGVHLPENISAAEKAKALSDIVGVRVRMEGGVGGPMSVLSSEDDGSGRMVGRKTMGRRGMAMIVKRAVEAVKKEVGVA